MKKLLNYLLDFFRKDCDRRALIAILLFTGVCVYINYFVYSESQWIKADPREDRRLWKYMLGYSVVYGGAWLLQAFAPSGRDLLRKPGLWGIVFFSAALFGYRAWISPSYDSLHAVPPQYYTAAWKIVVNLYGLVLLGIPCALFWLVADRRYQPLYGFRVKGVVLWPYFVLILGMLPLLALAGAQPDFGQVYPRGTRLGLPPSDPNRNAVTLLYEVCYSIDYVVTEFFFRGFLLLALARCAGPRVILPMCAFYVAIHFDKPLGEAISSFFGGLVLGVLAYRSRSIWGGVIVHLGIALAMELIGWLYVSAA